MNHSNDPDMVWLAENFKSEAEEILVSVGEARLRALGTSKSDFQATWLELVSLRQGRDFNYDTPECGVVYSWIYHQKRLQQAVRALHAPLRAALNDDPAVDIVDLGSGTGAVLWAVAALLLAFDARGVCPATPIRVLECDSSPFMLGTSTSLWEALRGRFPRLRALLTRIPSKPASWDRIRLDNPRSPWITASYLLHASETTSLESDMELVESLGRIADRVAASRIVTWHSQEKTPTMRVALESLMSRGWARDHLSPAAVGFTDAKERSPLIHKAFRSHAHTFESALDQRAPYPAYWYDEHELRCEAAARSLRASEGLFGPLRSNSWTFDPEQQTIVEDKKKHAVIRGAAGSGKTVVLAERLRQALAAATPSQPRNMLVTCFNKKVLDYILNLVEGDLATRAAGRLESDGKNTGKWTFMDSNATIRARNFDRLPPGFEAIKRQLGRVEPDPLQGVFNRVSVEIERQTGQRLEPNWLLDELRLVIVGRCQGSLDAYLRPNQRRGRPESTVDLKTMFQAFEHVLGSLENPKPPKTWEQRRAKLLHFLLHRDDQTPTIRRPCTDIFVDEGQDLTRSDWRILQSLAGPETAWTICLDRTQAIHTGRAFDSPSGVIEKLGGWAVALPGAYRVPRPVVRFSNKLIDLGYIKSGDGLVNPVHQDNRPIPVEPKMHALPGPRPIIVFGQSCEALRSSALGVLEAHAAARRSCDWDGLGDHRKGKVLIGDLHGPATQTQNEAWRLRSDLVRSGWDDVSVGSVLMVKGVEYDTVIWLADIPLDETDRWGERLFTLFTRTRGLLVIAFSKLIDVRARKFLIELLNSPPEFGEQVEARTLARWLPDEATARAILETTPTPAAQPPSRLPASRTASHSL